MTTTTTPTPAEIIMRPTSGEVVKRMGLIFARVEIGGQLYLNTNRGLGFDSVAQAQAFIDDTMIRGAAIPTQIAYRIVNVGD